MGERRFLLVDSSALPDVFLKVLQAKELLASGSVSNISTAARQAGISRSAFYKYRDCISPFQNMMAGRIITFQMVLKDKAGVLSSILSIFANCGANILTINQSIPVNGCGAVTISAETSGMKDPLDELIRQLNDLDGVVQFEILAG